MAGAETERGDPVTSKSLWKGGYGHGGTNKKSKKAAKRKRKPNLQRKITKYFKPVKIDGLPKKDFAYEPSVNGYVYKPHGYGIMWCARYHQPNTRRASFCPCCHLRPCILGEHEGDLSALTRHLHQEGKSSGEIRNMVCVSIKEWMGGYYGKRRAAKMQIPSCVNKYLLEEYPEEPEISDDEEESDVELDLAGLDLDDDTMDEMPLCFLRE